MLKFSLLLHCLFFTLILSFDPTKFDYCSINCNQVQHTACKCARRGNRTELVGDITPQQFRKIMLDRHNEVRNMVANGTAQSMFPHVPAATNMRTMNYDMELEYIARCHAVSVMSHPGKPGTTGHDKCRVNHNRRSVGQNISYRSNLDQKELNSLKGWIEEGKDLAPSTISQFEDGSVNGKVIGHFTQMVWAETDLVGCARAHNPDHAYPQYRYYVICNYGSTSSNSPGNRVHAPVYLIGEKPCSECPEGMARTEDERYDALCGKILPIPQEAPAKIPDEGEKVLSSDFA